jgi:hypothetical protein
MDVVYLFSKTHAAYLYKEANLTPITSHKEPSLSILSLPT